MFWEHHPLLARLPWAFLGSGYLLRKKASTRAPLSPPVWPVPLCLSTHRLHALGQGAACVRRDLRGEQPGNVRTPFLYRPALGKCGKKLSPVTDCSKEVLSCRKSWQKPSTAEPSPSTTQPTQPSERQLLTGHLPAWPTSDLLSEPMLAIAVLLYLDRAGQVALARNQRKAVHSWGVVFHSRWHVIGDVVCIGSKIRCAL